MTNPMISNPDEVFNKPKTSAKDVGTSAKKGIKFIREVLSPGKSRGVKFNISKPVQEDFTREQQIMRSMFGHGEKILINPNKEREVVRIDQTLTSGDGISPMKLRGNRETQNLMFSGNKSGFFGGRRR